ncbi:MAG: gamma-glutamyl-gamma-aminobutyrate hydrolase family protein [Kiritimatiellaeota bacterium]|nr:gamma-glutamyl-gamma-aminobutyrate hydrolase family protein [Kiritimatiellota bacterium]
MRLKEEQVVFLCAMLSLPLMLFLLPLMLAARFGRPRRGVRIALTVSNRWPAYLQFVRLPYDLAILRSGAKVVTISPKKIDSVKKLLDQVDAVIISGGEDVAPSDDAEEEVSARHNLDRDALELAVLKETERRGMPVLCVCRGMQLLSLSKGGQIACHDDDPDFGATHTTSLGRWTGHKVEIAESSRLSGILAKRAIRVNSLHHQHITDQGTLAVSARSPDFLIEAVEETGERFAIGVQWHPELLAMFELKEEKLFKALVAAAVAYRSMQI